MKTVIICAVTGNLPIVKECMDTWFPLPENWELYVYKSKFTYVDGTSNYLDQIKSERGAYIIEDGEHRGHVKALSVLFEEIKTKNFDWVIHLDTDAKLLNKEFYSWANQIFLENKYKVWGKCHSRGSSKVDKNHTLYLGRAHSWILIANMNFLLQNDINFDDVRIEGILSKKSNPIKILKSNEILNSGENVVVFGDTGWQLYTEASRLGVYQNLPDNIYKMWNHKNNQTEKWKSENKELIRNYFKI